MSKYKKGKTYHSTTSDCKMTDILKKKCFLGIIPYWAYDHTVKEAGQVDEVVFYLNNPEVASERIKQILNKVNQTGDPYPDRRKYVTKKINEFGFEYETVTEDYYNDIRAWKERNNL